MPIVNNLVPLPRLAGQLNSLPGITAAAPGYRQLSDYVRDGVIETVVHNGRHYVAPENVPLVARKLGMLPVAPPRARARRSAVLA